VARIETYEETADIHKAFVREEVKVKKVVEHKQLKHKLRREELDVDTHGVGLWMALIGI